MASDTLTNIKSIIVDIEGTTSSISFVKEVLFPYVRANLASYIEKNWGNDSLSSDIKLLREQCDRDKLEKIEGLVEIEEGENERSSLIKNIEWQMDIDRKETALKQLQGHIWEQGYKSGQLKGHVYDDVSENVKRWSEDGRRLYVYSSGSIEAQKLLFGNTTAGDLLKFFSGFFDTTTGPKIESKSYSTIAASIDCPADQILFLTDVVKEAEAAKTAGMQTVIVVREGNAPLSEEDEHTYATIKSFDDLVLERCAKRARTEAEPEPESVSNEKSEESATEQKEEAMDVDSAAAEDKSESSEEPSSTTETETPTDKSEKESDETNKSDEVPTTTTKEEEATVEKEAECEEGEEATVDVEKAETAPMEVEEKNGADKVESSTENIVEVCDDVKVEGSAETKSEASEDVKVDSSTEVKVADAEETPQTKTDAKETEEEAKADDGAEVKNDEIIEKEEKIVTNGEANKVEDVANGETNKVEDVTNGEATAEEVTNADATPAEDVKNVEVDPLENKTPVENSVNGDGPEKAESINGSENGGKEKAVEVVAKKIDEVIPQTATVAE